VRRANLAKEAGMFCQVTSSKSIRELGQVDNVHRKLACAKLVGASRAKLAIEDCCKLASAGLGACLLVLSTLA
jgi:hypothetical protein